MKDRRPTAGNKGALPLITPTIGGNPLSPPENRKDKRRKAQTQREKTTGGKASTSIRGKIPPLPPKD